jgi:CRP-like cAMP-binding protein
MELNYAEFEQYIQPFILLRRFDAKEMVSEAGTVENYFNFLLSGLARTYYRKGKDEIVTQIATEGHIIHAQESFHSRMPSQYIVETIEPSRFASITFNSLEHIYAGSNKMQHLGRLVVTYTMLLKEKMQLQATAFTPREQFLHFFERNPTLIQRVPQKYLASYLQITPETFSRFKHMLREKKLIDDCIIRNLDANMLNGSY